MQGKCPSVFLEAFCSSEREPSSECLHCSKRSFSGASGISASSSDSDHRNKTLLSVFSEQHDGKVQRTRLIFCFIDFSRCAFSDKAALFLLL